MSDSGECLRVFRRAPSAEIPPPASLDRAPRREAVAPRGNASCRATLASRGKLGGIDLNARAEPRPTDEPYRLEMENLSAAILGRGQPLLGRPDALGQARAIDALYRSAASSEAVSLEG